ncbi:hypothetical protein BANRA_05235 [Klebsiella pneumoniae]|nr:hypothetical protein BANRA_05235 [Klebsiella pneumoniae]
MFSASNEQSAAQLATLERVRHQMPSARVDALFAHAAQRKILSIVALAYRTNAAVSSTRIARSSSSLPRYAARALQMRGRCSAGKRSDTHAAATSLGAMRPVEALYRMRARARTTFRSSPFQSDSAFHWALVSKSALEKCSFGHRGSENAAADGFVAQAQRFAHRQIGVKDRDPERQARTFRKGCRGGATHRTEAHAAPDSAKALLRFERQQLAPAVAMFRHRLAWQ